MTPIVVTPPTAEPITLAEAKAHLRVVTADEDSYIEDQLIPAARAAAEERTNRALAAQRIKIGLSGFCNTIRLKRMPYQGDLVVKYLDPEGAEQTLAGTAYRVNPYVEPVQVTPAPGQPWPATSNEPGAVTLEYDVGPATAGDVSTALKQWMLLAIGAFYENRESVTAAVQAYELPHDFMSMLIQPYKVYE